MSLDTGGAGERRALPERVRAAIRRADRIDFTFMSRPLSSEPAVGWLLAALAAAVPVNGRILEMGTGVGVGTSWLVVGLEARADVELISVEIDPSVAGVAAEEQWPPYVSLRVGDAQTLLPDLGTFDLIFADSPAGKWYHLPETIAALRPGAALVMDDMDSRNWTGDEQVSRMPYVIETVLTHPDLIAAQLEAASGILLATRKSRNST